MSTHEYNPLHVREMGDGEQFTRKRNGPFLDGFLGISWQPSNDSLGAALDSREHNARRAIDAAEKALKRGRPSDAVQLLENVDTGAQPYARKLKMSALVSFGRVVPTGGFTTDSANG